MQQITIADEEAAATPTTAPNELEKLA